RFRQGDDAYLSACGNFLAEEVHPRGQVDHITHQFLTAVVIRIGEMNAEPAVGQCGIYLAVVSKIMQLFISDKAVVHIAADIGMDERSQIGRPEEPIGAPRAAEQFVHGGKGLYYLIDALINIGSAVLDFDDPSSNGYVAVFIRTFDGNQE